MKKQFIAIGVLASMLVVFVFAKNSYACMDALVKYVARPVQHTLGQLCDGLSFSMAEVIWVLFILFCFGFVARAIWNFTTKKATRGQVVCKTLLNGCILVLSVAVGFTYFWGVNYYTTPFETQFDVKNTPISVEALRRVTQLFTSIVNETAPLVKRNAKGEFAENLEAIFAESPALYTQLERENLFLKAPHLTPKKMKFSFFMSEINYTGFFFPMTGEANINVDAPACFIPSTIAHELAHVHGIAPENMANFAAILACAEAENPVYRYSGALLAYLHLSNALYKADYDAWRENSAKLCAEAKTDLVGNNQYWARYETKVAAVANATYDGFLKSYGQKKGLKSYGAVVDALVHYYDEA